MQLFFGNIPHECTSEDIQAFCETVGPVHKMYVPAAKIPGAKNAGYAFAMFKSRIAAAEALEQLSGQSIPSASSRPLVRIECLSLALLHDLLCISCMQHCCDYIPKLQISSCSAVDIRSYNSFPADADSQVC
jgi:RNA recognition motif. (a.k.a. RRM, RBD, or RNP domain)